MRLGQLARKLAVKPSELVDFLTTKGVSTESGINTRLESDLVKFIVTALAPEKLTEIMTKTVVQEDPEVIEVVESQRVIEEVFEVAKPEPVIVMEDATLVPAQVEQSKKKEVDTYNEEVTIIKFPKVELQGLTVLGKIELPDLKKKEFVSEATDATNESSSEPSITTDTSFKNTQPPVRINQPLQQRERTERNDYRPAKNPIALKREQEALEAERKRKERAELEKEKRTQNYMKRVKSAPTKAVKRIEEEQVTEVIEEEVKRPKTLIGKFLRWFKS